MFIPFALPDKTEGGVSARARSMRSGWLTTGPKAASLRKRVRSLRRGRRLLSGCRQLPHCQPPLGSGAARIGTAHEVIVPTWTFTSTAEVVRYLGATPVLVNVEPHTLNIHLPAAERAVSSRTRAIMPVHFAGLPVPPSGLPAFASQHRHAVVEDAAHTLPLRSDGRLNGDSESGASPNAVTPCKS